MRRALQILLTFVLVLAVLGACAPLASLTPLPSLPSGNPPPVDASTTIGKRTKTSGCVAHSGLPDQACTPGAVFPRVTAAQICEPGYSKSVRDVSSSTKTRVFEEYGVQSHAPGEYEVDHLISLELGGSNSIANLWPEPADPRPGFHEKDKVENYLHDQVCKGAMSLHDAQVQIATDWVSVYKRIQ